MKSHRKEILTIMALAIFIFGGCSSETPDFRNTNWGMSQEEVMKNESEKLWYGGESEIGGTYLFGEATIMDGTRANMEYYFTSNKLFGARYYVQSNLQNAKEDLEVYTKIRDHLIQKYGATKQNNFFHEWQNEKTIIRLDVGDYKINIAYISKELDEERTKNSSEL